jgi:DNA-binding NtrC family response regulator
MSQATQLFQSALSSSEEGGDKELEAWIAVFLLRHMFVAGRELAGAMVHATRAKVAKAGSAHATAYLHATVALAEGQAGRLREARRHLLLAQRLTATKPHPWLQCSILGATASIAIAEREFRDIEACFETLRATAHQHGLVAEYARVNVNHGDWAYLTGRYEAAEPLLQEAIDSPHTSRIAKLTATVTMAEIRLAQGRLAECEEILCDIKQTAIGMSFANIYAVQTAKLAQARLLMRRRQAHEAAEQLALLEAELHETSDRSLLAATRTTRAQALVMSGDLPGGARSLAAGMMMDPDAISEFQGHFYYAAASAVGISNRRLADALEARARRVWNSQGTSSLEFALSTASEESTDAVATVESSKATRDFVTLESISSLFALAGKPRLLAYEMEATIGRLRCSPAVALSTEPASDSRPLNELTLVVSHDPNPLTLTCVVPSSPDEALALTSLVRLGRYSLELERLRKAEMQRTALWPDDSIESSKGAIFESDAMRELLAVARRVAETSVPVLITGETGTGKEVLARLIHTHSRRSKGSFSPFNCTSMSRDMIESQLFGHRKGAFTGATDHSQGVVRAANNGTLLLDEVGDMHLDLQPKLLRFLESGEVHPVGESKPVHVDVRIIAATNVDLKARVAAGEFREDLYYRLSIVPLHLPPLRERRSEIPSLANHYLSKYGTEFGKGQLKLSEETLEYLLVFRWPGNIRQLANEMKRIAALAEAGAIVGPEHLSREISGFSASRKTEIARREARENEMIVKLDQPLTAAVEQVERAMIINAMGRADGAIEEAAQMLGLSRKGLYLKRQRYEIDSTLESLEGKS